MKNKTTAVTAGFLAGLFVLYNIILFIIAGFGGHSASFWVSFVFVVIAFALTAFFTLFIFKDEKPFGYWFLGFPILRWSVIYLALAIAVGALFMLVDFIQLAVIAQLLLIGGYSAVGVASRFAKAQVEAVDKKQDKVYSIRLIYAELDVLSKNTADGEMKKALTKLYETARYSDPNSDALLLEAETEIRIQVGALRGLVQSGDNAAAFKLISEINNMLLDRNAKCKALKR